MWINRRNQGFYSFQAYDSLRIPRHRSNSHEATGYLQELSKSGGVRRARIKPKVPYESKTEWPKKYIIQHEINNLHVLVTSNLSTPAASVDRSFGILNEQFSDGSGEQGKKHGIASGSAISNHVLLQKA